MPPFKGCETGRHPYTLNSPKSQLSFAGQQVLLQGALSYSFWVWKSITVGRVLKQRLGKTIGGLGTGKARFGPLIP